MSHSGSPHNVFSCIPLIYVPNCLVPGPSDPQHLSLEVITWGKGLEKLDTCLYTRENVWGSATFLEEVSKLLIANTEHEVIGRSKTGSLSDTSGIQKAIPQLQKTLNQNSPRCPSTSLQVRSSTRPSSTLALQLINVGVRKP